MCPVAILASSAFLHYSKTTGSLVYLAHMVGPFTDCFAWWQAVHQLFLLWFDMSWHPCALFQCTAVS